MSEQKGAYAHGNIRQLYSQPVLDLDKLFKQVSRSDDGRKLQKNEFGEVIALLLTVSALNDKIADIERQKEELQLKIQQTTMYVLHAPQYCKLLELLHKRK